MMASVRVAVRVRPLNKREKQLSSKGIIHMEGNTTSIHKPSQVRADRVVQDGGKTFPYDFSYDSADTESPTFASQEKIFQDLGSGVLTAAFAGLNSCVFAYGQTGSGKSYTMMGYKDDEGLIPRICEGLFREISKRNQTDAVTFHTEVSYLEIYNERVRDLLKKRPLKGSGTLKVREHPKDGPYVENLSNHLVHNYPDMEELILLGNANRTTAATAMNDFSSRSHAIFTIRFVQAWLHAEMPCETLSKLHLVDLAGSEKADATRTTGNRLKEGANINKSLVTLGSVISALADLGIGEESSKKKPLFIPYRNSVLTWLLKDSLGGNSLTTMIATISPADVNYMETLSTLRYASRAKNIMNSPTVNEGGSVKVIRDLQEEVKRLQRLLEEATQVSHGELSTSVEEKLHQSEAKVVALTKEWTDRWGETRCILQEATVALRKEGRGVVIDCQLPYLMVYDDKLLSTAMVLYYLKEGRTFIGSDEESWGHDILLRGPGLLSQHCMLENCDRTVTLFPQDGSRCSVNGSVVTNSCQLTQGAVIELGGGTRLWFNHPTEAILLRGNPQSPLPPASALPLTDLSISTESPVKVGRQNPGSPFTRMITSAADTAESIIPHNCSTSATTQEVTTTAIPGRHPVPHIGFDLNGDALQGGVRSTRDGQKQKRDSLHKSGPGLVSKRLQTKTPAGAASCKGEEVWSGDASLQQTSVLGPGDGCGTKPRGNANEIQGVVTDWYEGRPGSSGSSLASMSHLQSGRRTGALSVLPPPSAHCQRKTEPLSRLERCCPPRETTGEGQIGCGEMDESGGFKEIPGESQTVEATVQNSRLGSLFSTVSWIVKDAGRLIWSAPQKIGAHLSNQGVSLIRRSSVLPVVKASQRFSMVYVSFFFSHFRDGHIFSIGKDLPFLQQLQVDVTLLQPEEAREMIQGYVDSENSQLPDMTARKTLSELEGLPDDVPLIPKAIWKRNGGISDWQSSPVEQDTADIHSKQAELLPLNHIRESELTRTPQDRNQALESSRTVQIAVHPLIDFPDSLSNLQTLPLQNMMDALESIISTSVLTSETILALHWLNVATCSQPEPQPALFILMETGLYTLTSQSGSLVLFHHLPLLQLKEIQIGLAGQSFRLMGITKESILAVYTYSPKQTKEMCRAILRVICPGDGRVSQHPLLNGDLMTMCLDWQICIPDLLLASGVRVYCQFQKTLADLVYRLHSNMDKGAVPLGAVRLLLYTSVAVCNKPSVHSDRLAQFLLTDTHLGLLWEEAQFHPTKQSATIGPCHPRFCDLTLRHRSDVRCMLVYTKDESGSVGVDVILANARGRGHPESVTQAAALSPRALNSSPHAEVWKLTFSCSTEAACLINHLSNV